MLDNIYTNFKQYTMSNKLKLLNNKQILKLNNNLYLQLNIILYYYY